MNAQALLVAAMDETGTSQRELARISGVRQPSISQMRSGRIGISDDQLDRLLACMGRRLVVRRSAAPADLTRSERRSWLLHREVARRLDAESLRAWQPQIEANLDQRRRRVQGQPHERNIERWADLFAAEDLPGLHRVLTGLGRHAIEMREVSPMSGVLPEPVRVATLHQSR